jgi:hypothetical protein
MGSPLIAPESAHAAGQIRRRGGLYRQSALFLFGEIVVRLWQGVTLSSKPHVEAR